ncbi:recombinase family protein [uncultured Roseobacter sp.]|uniref:recombinase family protein n=1 Tax=uncultured Roseobacter sp. TaxID=114847 RepID=UPI00262F5EF2|nr:recombinase family protein [uncultured Roseobacter sp.]
MKPCFGYIRVSTQKQGDGASLDAQRDAITAFASQNNLTVSKWFEEKETAAKSGRPVFNLMLKQLKQGRVQGLIMHKIDRSARNLRDWALVSELPKFGVKAYFAADGLDMETRGGRLSANLQAVIAEDYIHNLREECIKGLRGRLKQGLYPFRAPIGYLNNGRGQPKTPCPEKAPLIQLAYDLYASGQHSINSLQLEMRDQGLTNHGGQPVSKHGIETILRNPFYCGLIRIKRSNETFDGIHEPLISTYQFKLVQDLKAGKAGKKVTRHNHMYRGLFRCITCGRSMIPERQKAHVYYRCQTKTCPKNIVREDRLDQAVRNAYEMVRIGDNDVTKIKTDWLAWLHNDERQGMLASLDLRIAKAEERQHRLTDLLLDGAIDRTVHDDRKHALWFKLATLREERAELAKLDLSEDQLTQFLELVTNLAELHIWLNVDEKRYLLKNCFSNLVVQANEPVLEPYSWLSSRDFGELTPLVNQLGPLLELLSCLKISTKAADESPSSSWRSSAQ